ncbi:MAG: response regulator [Bacteroidaceae bacterium]|nr:response regulator [Bacteroidaceae bacterium]
MMKHGTILIIDDNASVLTAAKICLAGTFGRIVTLPSPEKALHIIAEEQPQAILLDMNFSMGVSSGQEGMMWLSAIHRRFPDTPIVLITAYADIKLAVRALKNGAADFVTKPWDNDELIRILKDAIDKAGEVVPLEQLEAEHMRKALAKCGGNMKRAADMLGISRQTLYNKLKNE